jgi:crotonobetainyl-CoA:carnitine CoA-transferase CaiB-like acyl-CoA transferase
VKDGWFTLRAPAMDDGTWAELASVIDRDDLRDDPRFATAEARRKNERELNEIVRAWALGKTRDEVWVALRDLGYFGAPVLSLEEVMEDPHVKARGVFKPIDHPTFGPTVQMNPWIHMSRTPTNIDRPSPKLGEHTDYVLGDIVGLAPDEIAELRSAKVVR